MNEIITIETLPVIKYKLEQLSIEIKEKVNKANSLVVTEDTIKEVKQVRADLNKDFNELETQRKYIKEQIMSKYNEFESVYKDKVANLYKNADLELKTKIDNVENELKKEKEEELREFVKQHCDSRNIHINFEKIGLNITLSASMKSLKDQALAFIEKVDNDLKLIALEEYSDEILIEYNETLDFTNSKLKVIGRHKQIEEIKKQQEFKEQIKQEEQKNIEIVNEIIAPKEILEDEDIIKVAFTIETTKSNVKELKEWLKERGIKYE